MRRAMEWIVFVMMEGLLRSNAKRDNNALCGNLHASVETYLTFSCTHIRTNWKGTKYVLSMETPLRLLK